MLVMILKKAPPSLKGALSRWLIEPSTGVFLGNPSARVRDKLWEKAVARIRDGSVVQIWNTRCPQGYTYRQHGNDDRMLVDHDGLALVRIAGKEAGDTRRHRARKKKSQKENEGRLRVGSGEAGEGGDAS